MKRFLYDTVKWPLRNDFPQWLSVLRMCRHAAPIFSLQFSSLRLFVQHGADGLWLDCQPETQPPYSRANLFTNNHVTTYPAFASGLSPIFFRRADRRNDTFGDRKPRRFPVDHAGPGDSPG